jgi:adenosylmethionine-8-amino-7-oxononanoate aminotransferase
VLTAERQIVEALAEAGTPFVMGHTYAQNPVTAAAGLAVLEYIKKHDLVRAAEQRGSELFAGLRELGQRHSILGDVRGLGLMIGIELVQDQVSRRPFPIEAGVAFALARACIEEGAAIYPGQGGADGQVGDHALVTPPLTISSAQIHDLVSAIDRGLSRTEALLGDASSPERQAQSAG